MCGKPLGCQMSSVALKIAFQNMIHCFNFFSLDDASISNLTCGGGGERGVSQVKSKDCYSLRSCVTR